MTTATAQSAQLSQESRPDAGEAALAELQKRYDQVRSFSVRLCERLAVEDYVVQTMPDVSPTKWHLAHTTWFFETLALREHLPDYRPLNAQYVHLFNSYYNAIGPQFSRPHRGTLSRPTVTEVYEYRRYVDEHMDRLFAQCSGSARARLAGVVEIGLHHEQQHQELTLTDIKHVFACNPLRPVYSARPTPVPDEVRGSTRTGNPIRQRSRTGTPEACGSLGWHECAEGVYDIGHEGPAFAYDNERPRHKVYLQPFAVASRPVTNGEFMAFMEDGGYQRPELWLSDGWNAVQEQGWRAPLYWGKDGQRWRLMTLSGMRDVDPAEPVCHVSYYEADAYARWAGGRLLTEAEWEVAARDLPIEGNFVEVGVYHPVACAAKPEPSRDRLPFTSGSDVKGKGAAPRTSDRCPAPFQMFGDVWEWTGSPYVPYPGFEPAAGALGEYNGKFMCNQMVLRGGSCATPITHIRPTYRNFFPPSARWQFTGIRLGRTL